MLDLKQSPHRRLNVLTGEWVLVSPHRTSRPWQGQVEEPAPEKQPTYDPTCYLCPGNERAGGVKNPKYTSTFVFENDFAAMMPGTAAESLNQEDLLVAEGSPGTCRVICFSPRHDLTLARMTRPEIRAVVDVWAEQFLELGSKEFINYVQVFENRGAMMGASNPHPHCQVWASNSLPNEPAKESARLIEYAKTHGRCLLCDYLHLEQRSGERIVVQNEIFSAMVPFWAIWPFETLVVSNAHRPDMPSLNAAERDGLADILKRLTAIYDRVFAVPFPYTMGFHQQPTDGRPHGEAHLHAHFFPPLLRSATVRKFMVGYEMLSMPQRDITPESAAERLRTIASQLPSDIAGA